VRVGLIDRRRERHRGPADHLHEVPSRPRSKSEPSVLDLLAIAAAALRSSSTGRQPRSDCRGEPIPGAGSYIQRIRVRSPRTSCDSSDSMEFAEPNRFAFLARSWNQTFWPPTSWWPSRKPSIVRCSHATLAPGPTSWSIGRFTISRSGRRTKPCRSLLLESMTWCAVSWRDEQPTRKADRGEGQSALGLGTRQPARRSIVQWSVDACCPPACIPPRASIRDRSLAAPFGSVSQCRSLFPPPFRDL
jgi:hypothetical protein